jgi:hypothetical protein
MVGSICVNEKLDIEPFFIVEKIVQVEILEFTSQKEAHCEMHSHGTHRTEFHLFVSHGPATKLLPVVCFACVHRMSECLA